MFSNKLTIEDVPSESYSNKVVIMRVDFNVPMTEDLKVRDDSRITKTLPTLKFLLKQKVKSLIILSHLGRPKGKVVAKLSIKPVAEKLEELLKEKVTFVGEYVKNHENVKKIVQKGGVFFFENTRFHKEETEKPKKDKNGKLQWSNSVLEFRKVLSSFGDDVFVFDAFSVAHRPHSSVVGVNLKFKASGYLIKKEMEYFGKALKDPKRPFLAILGGSKVDTKIGLINNLLNIVDELIIAGGMCFSFMKILHGMKIGNSIYDKDNEEKITKIVKDVMKKAKEKNVKIHIPVDYVCGNKWDLNPKYKHTVKEFSKDEGIGDGFMGLDIGSKSIEQMKKVIENSKTILFNGPPGVFEVDAFQKGSKAFVEALVKATEKGSISIICGGDTAALVNLEKMTSKCSHVSTGGGASLELCEGKILPGFDHISIKK